MNHAQTFPEYIKKNKILLLALGVFIIAFCAFRIICPTISYDTDQWLYDPSQTLTHWLGIGRFSLVFLKHCFGTGTSLLVLNIVTYVFVFIYTVLFLYFLNIESASSNGKRDFLCGLVLISSPIFLEQYYFTLQSAEVAFAMVLIIICFIFTWKIFQKNTTRIGKLVFCMATYILLAFTMGIYQTFANLYVIGVLICLFKMNQEDKKENIKNVGISAVVFLAALASYFAISRYVINYFGVSNNEYIGVMWFSQPVMTTVKEVVVTIGRVILGLGNVLNLSYTFCLIYVIYQVVKAGKPYVSWRNFYLLALLFSPFLLNVLTGTNFVIRSVLGFPVLCAFVFWEYYHTGTILKIALGITLLSQVVHSELLLYGDYVRNQNDLAIAEKVYADCNANKDTVIVFKGIETTEENGFSFKGQAMGHSFFEWSGDMQNAEEVRILYFMHAYGLDFTGPTAEQLAWRDNLTFSAEYPDEGYIQEENWIYYVNLGVE